MCYTLEPETWTTEGDGSKCQRTLTVLSHRWQATRMPFLEGRIPSLTARRVLDRPTGLNRELNAAEGARTGLGPLLGGAWVVCRFWVVLDR